MAIIDRIKFSGSSDVLVWKWPSDAITLGSQLIVNESQEAIFYKGGQALDLFGPGTHTLATGNLPLLRKIINLPFGGQTPFAAEVYFINKSVSLAHDWGTASPIMVLDPRYRVAVPLRAYGTYAMHVIRSREFLVQIVGASAGATADVTAERLITSPLVSCLQQCLATHVIQRKICVLDIPAHALELGDGVASLLRSRFGLFGIDLLNLTVESINFDPDDETVQRLRKMLDDAARLDYLGDAARRNNDFYRTDQQFEVLKRAADSHGASGLVGAGVGVGLGLGLAHTAGELTHEVMASQPLSPATCLKCRAEIKIGAKFCGDCGTPMNRDMVRCAFCDSENVPTAQYCASCGQPLRPAVCRKCGKSLASGTKFCGECGEKQ